MRDLIIEWCGRKTVFSAANRVKMNGAKKVEKENLWNGCLNQWYLQ